MKRTHKFLLLLFLMAFQAAYVIYILPEKTQAAPKMPVGSSSDDSTCNITGRYVVSSKHIVQSDLYTWTTKEQIELLRNGQPLLSKSQSEKYGKANYDLLLESKKAAGDSIAAMLLNERFAKKRFAWPHPWATVRGYPGEHYGDQLLRITFSPQAVFCSVVSITDDKTEYHFYTNNEQELSLAYVKAHPERIAVVYFVDKKKTKKKSVHYRGTYSRSRAKNSTGDFPYREYVICNPYLIQSYSYGTAGIISVMKDDISFLKSLSGSVPSKHSKGFFLSVATPDYWNNGDGDYCVYESTVALVNKYYDLTYKQLNLTIDALQNAIKAQGQPFTINPK